MNNYTKLRIDFVREILMKIFVKYEKNTIDRFQVTKSAGKDNFSCESKSDSLSQLFERQYLWNEVIKHI